MTDQQEPGPIGWVECRGVLVRASHIDWVSSTDFGVAGEPDMWALDTDRETFMMNVQYALGQEREMLAKAIYRASTPTGAE